MADIKAIKEKLAALLARARDAGSSEAEVAACMAKAHKMMETYGVSEADLENVTADSFRDFEIPLPEGMTVHCPVVRYCAPMVGRVSAVTFWINNGRKDQPICGLGLEPDVEYALWLLRSLRIFMDDQWKEYRDWQLDACTRDELKAERIGFIRGFCETVNDRLRDMYRHDANATGLKTGTALVVRKADAVDEELARRGMKLGRGKSLGGRGRGAHTGAAAGAVAGQAASLGRGIGGGAIAIGKA